MSYLSVHERTEFDGVSGDEDEDGKPAISGVELVWLQGRIVWGVYLGGFDGGPIDG